MKYKNYGNNKEFDSGLNLELIQKNDSVSDRSINRPLINLNENQEEIYEILNNLAKTVYGNKTGILPGIYEDFDAEGFIINSFKNDSKNFYIRIPTGAMILDKSKDPNSYYNFGEKFYKDEFADTDLTNDKFKSFSYINRPNINLLERQLADLIGLDLNDLENDIKVEATEVPISYPVYILDKENLPISDNSGNFKKIFLEKNGKTKEIFYCSQENAEYYALKSKVINQERPVILASDPQGTGSKAKTINRFFVIEDTDTGFDPNTIFTEVNGVIPEPENKYFFTTDLNKAIRAIDYNGEEKKRIGYNLKASISTELGTQDIYLPNKKESSNWELYLPSKEATPNGGAYEVLIKDKLGGIVKSFGFTIVAKASAAEVNNNLLRAFIVNANDLFNVKRVYKKEGAYTNDGIKIESKLFDKKYNDYTVSITIDKNPLSSTTGEPITDIKANNLVEQKYYYNIFELLNGFTSSEGLGNYLTANANLYNFISGETILKLNNNENITKDYYIYYDLDFDTNKNKNNNNYDKSGRLFISEENITKDNLIKLFKLNITGKNDDLSKSKPKINSIEFSLNKLDRKTIYTKKSELNSLSVSKRSDLKNHFNVNSNNGRAIEINSTEAEPLSGNLQQTRIFSPLLRLTTGNNVDISKPEITTGDDNPIDLTDLYISKDLNNDTTKNNYHKDDDLGLILNKNKGLRLYSEINNKPIEVVSKNSDINIINKSGKIGIKSLTDIDEKNIDILGITQIRSQNDNQLVINRSVGTSSSKAAIKFQNQGSDLGNLEFYSINGTKNFNLNLNGENSINSTLERTTIKRSLSINPNGSYADDDVLIVKGKTNIIGDTSINSSDNSSSYLILNNASTTLTTPIATITSSDNIGLKGDKKIKLTSGSSIATLIPESITLDNTTDNETETPNNSNITLDSLGNSIIKGTTKTELISGNSNISLVPDNITLQNTESSKLVINSTSASLATPTTTINSSTKIGLTSVNSDISLVPGSITLKNTGSSTISINSSNIGISSTNVNIKGTTTIDGTTKSTGKLTASQGISITAGGLDITSGGLTITAGGATINDGATINTGNLTITSGGASIPANQLLELGKADIKADANGNIIFSWA